LIKINVGTNKPAEAQSELIMSSGRRVEIRRQKRLFDDFFKIDELIVAHQRFDGSMSGEERRLVFERGDAVAVLLFDADARAAVLVEQFRAPTLIARRRDDPASADGWIVELVAGMIDEGENAEQAAIREVFEETGYRIANPRLIGKFFSSPGGSDERFFLYFAGVREAQREGNGGGIAGEEDIKVFQLGVDDLFRKLAQGAIEDPKLAIAAYWLKDNINRP
jgi:nudix-type nucleoside diphosphatase (YffH/AdpP family)